MYAILGTSRHIAIGPTAVVSLLLGSLLKDYVNPDDDPTLYLQLAFTATFFSGIIQLGMGLLRYTRGTPFAQLQDARMPRTLSG